LATLLLKGYGIENNHEARSKAKEKAIQLLHETEDIYWRSAENLAHAYAAGDRVPKDPKIAIEKFKKALELYRAEKNPSQSPQSTRWEESIQKEIDKLQKQAPGVQQNVNVPYNEDKTRQFQKK